MEERKKDTEKTTVEHSLRVMLTQAVVCAVALLLVLILRLLGGGGFAWLRGTIHGALEDASLLTGLSSHLYGTTTTTTTTVQPIETVTTTQDSQTTNTPITTTAPTGHADS